LEEIVYQKIINHFPAEYNFRDLYAATCGATRKSEESFYEGQIYFCSLFIPYVYSNVELLRGKHQKTQHLFCCLLAIICVLKILKMLGQEAILSTEEEVLVAFLDVVVTPCRLIVIYHPFLFYQEVRGGRFLHLYG
jgi:hypothetical protein